MQLPVYDAGAVSENDVIQAYQLKKRALTESDPRKQQHLEAEADELLETRQKHNVTVYGSINLCSDGDKVVIAYMLEKPSRSRR